MRACPGPADGKLAFDSCRAAADHNARNGRAKGEDIGKRQADEFHGEIGVAGFCRQLAFGRCLGLAIDASGDIDGQRCIHCTGEGADFRLHGCKIELFGRAVAGLGDGKLDGSVSKLEAGEGDFPAGRCGRFGGGRCGRLGGGL